MSKTDPVLAELAAEIERHPAVLEKARIHRAYGPAESVSGGTRLGDDAAVLKHPTTTGSLLFASEGMLDAFVERDPWFAGYSAVMVNVSDVASMGGWPIAVTTTLWTDESSRSGPLWEGLQAASRAYGVPIVGGHTTRTPEGSAQHLGASILGYAPGSVLTSFAARPGDVLAFAVDLSGKYRLKERFFNASTDHSPEILQAQLRLLPEVARLGYAHAAKDVSNGGLVGTLHMLCSTSGVGAEVHLENLPRPVGVPLHDWILTFPSYGFLLALPVGKEEQTASLFCQYGIECQPIGHFTTEAGIRLRSNRESVLLSFP